LPFSFVAGGEPEMLQFFQVEKTQVFAASLALGVCSYFVLHTVLQRLTPSIA